MTGCAAPRHAAEPVPAAPHAVLCYPCTARLRGDLRRLPSLHAMLAALLDPRSSCGPGTGDGGGLPYHEPASEAMSQIAHDVSYWTAQVLAERQPPACPVRSLPVMCGWLAGYVPWISLRPWAGDMAGALASDARDARAVLNPMPVKLITLHGRRCPGCGAMALAAVVYSEDDRRPSAVTCGGCGDGWEFGPEWIRLGRDIGRREAVAA